MDQYHRKPLYSLLITVRAAASERRVQPLQPAGSTFTNTAVAKPKASVIQIGPVHANHNVTEETYGRVYDQPALTDEERAAEHGLRHDLLLIKLYDLLEPAFGVSLSWPLTARREATNLPISLGVKSAKGVEMSH